MLLFVAAAAFATSCDAIEDAVDDLTDDLEDTLGVGGFDDRIEDMTLYTGTTTVSNGYEIDTVKFYAEEDGTLSIVMIDAQFNQYMPVIDIAISDIAVDSEGAFVAETLTPEVVMEVEGIKVNVEDVSSYIITGTSGTYSEESLSVTFSCMGCEITFTGSAE